jgi:phenylpropionate dioxygenase-like ring-hydroxylating dioxygenase large terminal subunit
MEGSVRERPVDAPARTTRLAQYWHPIAASSSVTEEPRQFVLLDEKLVAFRTADGVSVFKDLCVHRGAALSLGWVRNGCIVCPYHGWEYDRTGACVRIPSLAEGSAIPARARAVAYHAEERYGLVWVALEDPVAPIPGFPQNEFEDPAYTGELFSVLTWDTSAGRSTENSMDVSHFPFVHANILADPEFPQQEPYVLHETDWGQHYRVDNQFYRSVDGSYETRVSYEYYHWYPFTMHIRIIEDADRVTVVTVAASPTGSRRTNVFRIVHRNYESDDPEFVANYLYVLEQDRRVVESIRPEEIPTSLKEELHIRVPDLASIAYRRWLGTVDLQGVLDP